MKITEPVTMLTDYVLGLLALYWAIRLLGINRGERHTSRALWAAGFIATAGASLLGGTFHGFKLHLSDGTATVLWTCTVQSIGLASWAMLSAVVMARTEGGLRRVLLALVAGKWAVYAVWMTTHSEFSFVVLDYGSAMVAILMAEIYAWAREKSPEAPWLIGGVVTGLVAGLMQSMRVSLHAHFNHNDLFHVLQMAAFYMFYRGGGLLRDREAS